MALLSVHVFGYHIFVPVSTLKTPRPLAVRSKAEKRVSKSVNTCVGSRTLLHAVKPVQKKKTRLEEQKYKALSNDSFVTFRTRNIGKQDGRVQEQISHGLPPGNAL